MAVLKASTITFINILLWTVNAADDTNGGPVIKTDSGIVVGKYITSYEGSTVSAFEGIPFAKPPVGPLRFQNPEPINKWKRILVANQTYTCAQFAPKQLTNAVIGTEDCLYLYIYVPREKITGDENLDVVLGIHSGAFMRGSPHSLMGPEYLMDRDLIYVTMNYRLGILGFLSTEDDVVPGNNGLKDQVLAMQWIKDNIKYFGGNPNSITATGVSAGGSSVHFHYMSPMSKGLFHRGFSLSGTALNSWALTENPADKARKLAHLLDCPQEPSTAMVDCLRKVDVETLNIASDNFYVMFKRAPLTPFGPVVEKGAHSFLPDHPYKLLQNGEIENLPWITSNTIDEGILAGKDFVLYDGLGDLDAHWNNVILPVIDCNDTVDEKYGQVTARKLRKFYFKDENLSVNNIGRLINLFSDRLFILDAEKALRLHAEMSKSPVYYYLFSYKLENGASFPEKVSGIAHMDDASLLYTISSYPKKISGADEILKNLFLDFLQNFASGRNPKFGEILWKPVKSTSNEIRYLHIDGPNSIQMKTTKEFAPTEFWNSLPIKENQFLYQNSLK